MSTLKRSTLAEQAYEELKGQIVSGRRPAGQRLLAEELAEELAISQTPVKEALALLERDGLVAGQSRRGSTVRRFTPEDIAEIYEARIVLELQAVEIGMKKGRVTEAFLARIETIFQALVSNLQRGTSEGTAAAIELDREFHEVLVGLAGNHLLSNWHRTVIRQFQTVRNYSLQTYTLDQAGPGHRAIVEALRSGEARNVVRTLREHLAGSRNEMLARPAEDRPIRP
jgi:DNA-binding GntR family transcriptional regulator